MYYFAALQQISAFRPQAIDAFFSKFKAEINDLIPNLQKYQLPVTNTLKLLKQNYCRTSYAVRF